MSTPVELEVSAPEPTAVPLLPSVLFLSASKPIAVLSTTVALVGVVLSAVYPIAVLRRPALDVALIHDPPACPTPSENVVLEAYKIVFPACLYPLYWSVLMNPATSSAYVPGAVLIPRLPALSNVLVAVPPK